MAKVVCLVLPLSTALSAIGTSPALADGALIWTPARVAPRVYQTTVGLHLPVDIDASAGADLGLSTQTGGRLLTGSELATLWGKIADSRTTLDGKDERSVVLRIDTLRSNGGVSLNQSQKWIYSPDLDLQATRSFNLNYVSTNSTPASVDLTQALTMTYAWAGTALSASSTVTSATDSVTGSVALNQPIAPHLNFTASLADPLSTTRSGDVQMRYHVKW